MSAADVVHIITEPTRYKILQLLYKHTYCVKALSKKLDISESAVSQHMNILKKYHVVVGKKIGYQTHYQVNKELLTGAAEELKAQLEAYNVSVASDDCSCEFISECIKRAKARRE